MLEQIITNGSLNQLNLFMYGDLNNLSQSVVDEQIQLAQKYINFKWQPLSATLFMDYTKTGNRVNYELIYFEKRKVLTSLVMGEYLEKKGRFLDDIINGIYSICEESAWQLPAHNSYVRDEPSLILPNTHKPIVDLFAGETGGLLSAVYYLLNDVFDSITPIINERIYNEIQTRIINPYLTEHFWWKGDKKSEMCNWTTWCTQNVLLSCFLFKRTNEEYKEVLDKSIYSLECFLDGYGDDGCCNEGAQYFRHAGLCLFNCLEIISFVNSQDLTNIYLSKKISNIANYIKNVHVDDKYYINFADCSPIAGRSNVREFLFGKKTNNISLMNFSSEDFKKDDDIYSENSTDLVGGISLYYRILTLSLYDEIVSHVSTSKDLINTYYESVGVFLSSNPTYYLAVKAGHNDDSHNHNDTGSFTIYKKGVPYIIDIGVGTYTKETFSSNRYSIWTMQSKWHNLPTFDGIMQKNGKQYKANNVQVLFEDTKSSISLDIKDAYPPIDTLTYYNRTVSVSNSSITVVDKTDYVGLTTMSIVTHSKPLVNGCVVTVGNIGTITSNTSDITITTVPVTDYKLKNCWGDTLYLIEYSFYNEFTLDIN